MANPEVRSKPTPKILVNQSNLVGTTVQQSTDENNCQNAYESLNEFFTLHEPIFTAAASGLASLQYEDSSVVETSVSTFTEYCPIIVQGLDWLGQLHPFIEIATKAFSVVITMNLTRINNNKKVIALQMQIQSTMMVLFELRRLKKLDQKLEGTMEKTMRKIANDIKEAGSVCDHYTKKNFVVKTLNSSKYETRLAAFGAKFAQHREELALALNVRTALGVDIVNQKLDGLTKQNESLQMTMIEIFKKLDTAREIEAKRYIEDLGGPEQCLKDGKHVQVLIEISGEGLGAFHVRRTGDDDKDFETARKKLLQDFSEDLDQAFNRNLSFFERKMDMQCKQMQNIIEESLHNEGLLILSVLKAGIHDRIIDPDMKCLWKENEWKGSVKARHFVLALQDFYIERQYPSPTNSPVQPLSAISNVSMDLALESIVKDDRWALKYIKVSRLQPILEAIDDDGTGFISIKEVNTFVGFKPDGWSLPVWIAYWAAGWHADMVHYKRKIHAVIREMYQVLDYDALAQQQKTLPINRYSLDEYLHSEPFSRIDILLRSLHPLESSIDDPKMKRVIDAFSSEEERRLEENLEGIAYDIDSPGTVVLVTGPGRIERFILPLIYLMLKRHLEVFYLAQAHVIHDEEFWDLSASLRNVFTMLDDRIKSLEAILKQTISDVSGKLSSFAFGLLQLSYPVPATRCPKENSLRPWNEEGRGIEIPVEGMSAEQIKEIPLKILKYGSKNTLESQIYDYSLSTFNPSDRRPKSRHPLSGYWAGHLLTQDPDELFSAEGLFQISITDVDQNGKISGKAEAYHGLMTVSGHISRESSRSLSLQFLFEDGTNIECEGQFTSSPQTLSGKFSFKKSLDSDDDVSEEGDIVHGHGSTQTFVFSRQSAFTWLSLPLAQTKTARGRWVFVIGAVLNRVKRKRLTWSYIKARMAERRRFLELMVRREADFEFNLTASDPLSYEEGKELRLLTAKIHPTDARFYYSFIPSLINTNFVTHLDCVCHGCSRGITRFRFICLVCISDDFAGTLDLCLNCSDALVTSGSFTHTPSHPMLKVESVIHDGELAWAIPRAREIASKTKGLLCSKNNSNSIENRSGSGNPKGSKMRCCCCSKAVGAPCWVCLYCSPDAYICNTCEKNRTLPRNNSYIKHHHKRPLVRVFDISEIADRRPTIETRLDTLEGKLAAVEDKLQEFTNRFDSLTEMLRVTQVMLQDLLPAMTRSPVYEPVDTGRPVYFSR